jgi:RimJ/RimL family protein N-acetyltransferase
MIRRVTVDDVGVYREVRLRALQDSPDAFASTYATESVRPQSAWAERVARCATGSEFAMFLAFDDDDGSCVGLAGIADDEYGADRQLVSMWVDPRVRGSGAASGLVGAIVDWCRESGVRTLSLWVTRGNDRAQRFYEKLGFTATGEVQPLPSDPCKDEIRMLCELGRPSDTGMCS